jgi:hypothetical protein
MRAVPRDDMHPSSNPIPASSGGRAGEPVGPCPTPADLLPRGGPILILALMLAVAICGSWACRPGGREPSPRADVASPAELPSATPAASADVAQQCLRRGQLALTSSKTVVQAVSEFHCALQGPAELAGMAHRGLAIAYAELGERQKALSHLESCLQIAPGSCDRDDIIRRLSRSGLPTRDAGGSPQERHTGEGPRP